MKWILLTNDDGIHAKGIQLLVDEISSRGHGVVVMAPKQNNSAVSMKLSLGVPLRLESIEDDRENVFQFSLDGSPCDCVIASLDGGLDRLLPGIIPSLVVSGINLGPNLSQDSYHSGTIAAAREAGLYGMPAIASSWSSFDPEGMELGAKATADVVDILLDIVPLIPINLLRNSIGISRTHASKWPDFPKNVEFDDIKDPRNAFFTGDIFLNLNVPNNWNQNYKTTRLGMRWYKNAVKFTDDNNQSTFTIGAAEVTFDEVHGGDVDADNLGFASISCIPSWPQTHPLDVDPELLKMCFNESENGLPKWITD